MQDKTDVPKVAVVMGSKSDRAMMSECKKYLAHFGIEYEEFVLSAHRTPDETAQFATYAEDLGFKVIIAGAGLAAHLPGFIAAHTTLPVIGVPLSASELRGLDALYSIVQMPSGVPVATMALDAAGAINAAVLAAQILALENEPLKNKLRDFKNKGCKIEKTT